MIKMVEFKNKSKANKKSASDMKDKQTLSVMLVFSAVALVSVLSVSYSKNESVKIIKNEISLVKGGIINSSFQKELLESKNYLEKEFKMLTSSLLSSKQDGTLTRLDLENLCFTFSQALESESYEFDSDFRNNIQYKYGHTLDKKSADLESENLLNEYLNSVDNMRKNLASFHKEILSSVD